MPRYNTVNLDTGLTEILIRGSDHLPTHLKRIRYFLRRRGYNGIYFCLFVSMYGIVDSNRRSNVKRAFTEDEVSYLSRYLVEDK